MRILIADDERRIREGLVRHIRKMEGNYTIDGVFANGKELLDYMEQHETDIVITDIRMPVVDGLNVSKEIKLKWPMTRVIILSGYCEFEYAKASIQFGVSDFLVKPVKLEELQKTLEKVSQEVKERWQKKWELHQQEQIVDRYREQVIRAWLNDAVDAISERKTFFFSEKMQAYRVIYAEGGLEKLFWMLQNLPYTSCKMQYYNLTAGNGCLFLEYDNTDEFDYIMDSFSIPGNYCITAGVSSLKTNERELPNACREALSACKRHWYCDGTMFFAEKPCEFETSDFQWRLIDEAIAGIFSCNEEIFTKRMEDVKEAVHTCCVPVFELRNIFAVMFQRVNIEAERIGLKDESKNWKELLEILDFDNIDKIFIKISAYFLHVQKQLEQILSYRNVKKINEVIVYINEHLNEDIALQDACDHVGISPAYLSRTFKEKTGSNFVDYVNRQKIERAKKMLTTGDMTSEEIARELAFNDAKYFSRLFKKMVGMTPQTYRKVSR